MFIYIPCKVLFKFMNHLVDVVPPSFDLPHLQPPPDRFKVPYRDTFTTNDNISCFSKLSVYMPKNNA